MFTTFFESLIDQLSLLRVADAIDILLVTVLVYIVLKFIRDTHTTRLLKGVVLIVVVVQLVYLFNLHVTTYTFKNHAAWFLRAGNHIPAGTETRA